MVKKKDLRVAIPCTLCWAGGTDLLRHFVLALTEKENVSVYLLFPQPKVPVFVKIKEIIKKIIRYKSPVGKYKSSLINQDQMMDFFRDTNVIMIKHKDSDKGLKKALRKNNIDVLFPLTSSPKWECGTPWIGYIPDLQHKHLPEFFSEREMKAREETFSSVLKSSPGLIVTARTTKEDILQFYPKENEKKIFPLPLISTSKKINDLPAIKELKEKHQLPKKYFMVCNQFWIHKSHITAFEALKILREKHPDIELVCSGNTHDYRKPHYFDELMKKVDELGLTQQVHILGHIPKSHQLSILKNSIALIQPTLFEGASGGGSVLDAKMLGIPAILSDIPINKEIVEENVFFFKTKDSQDLANKMFSIVENPEMKNSIDKNMNKKSLGDVLLSAIDYSIKNYKRKND